MCLRLFKGWVGCIQPLILNSFVERGYVSVGGFMSQKTTSYKIASDYFIDCITKEDVFGNKLYSVDVMFEPLGILVYTNKGIKTPEEANKCFKKMVAMYKGI